MKTNVDEETETANGHPPRGGGKSGSANPDQTEMMQKLQAAGEPGPAHRALDAFVGDWKAEVKCWTKPGSPASASQATAKATWIFLGRFLEEEFHGEMMGKTFTGRCLLGFDNTKQKFKSVWMDDLSTAIMTSEGKGDSGNKVLTLEGKADCPGTGRKDVPIKQVFRVLSSDKHVLELFNDGKKTMEITYSRR